VLLLLLAGFSPVATSRRSKKDIAKAIQLARHFQE
jgi:hypothetical protein